MYQSIEDLPSIIRDNLPRPAQELYRATYNRTWEQLAAGEEQDRIRITTESHKAARLAVEYKYTQDDTGRWRRNSTDEELKDNQEPDFE